MERYARDLTAGLVKCGLRPVVYSRGFDLSLEVFQHIDPVKIDFRWMPKKLRDVLFFYKAGKKAADVDLLISCTPTKESGIAICGGNHLGYLAAMSNRRRRLSDRLKIALDREGYLNARLIVAHSRRMQKELTEYYGVPESRIQVIYPPVDTQRFSVVTENARREARQRFGFKDDDIVLALPSTSHLRKGVDVLNAYFADTSLPVVLAVAGSEFQSSNPAVRSLGYLEDIETLYQAADYTVVASRYEPFGLVGVESVLCGTPLLIAENVGCREVLAESAYISFSIDDVGSLARGVETAVARVRNGEPTRISAPDDALSYDPSVESHVSALLEAAGLNVDESR
ncbi:glycosyltransferase family 4 protein [Halomonas mongoliensis]|uniref:glycosyltransferase family 4 protein n=1 Tax=Halomonas mongoliensis TaxID=321265 RepID=UPI00403B34D5